MAKVGEGDPRWLVENREDGKNVNNWHWSEKDCFNWSKQKFQTLLASQVIVDNEKLTIKTATTVTVTGECTSNNRKGKTIFLYELEVKVSWEGFLKSDADKKIKGDYVIPYISDENADEKARVNVSLAGDASGDDADTLKDAARKFGIPILQEKVAQYVVDLKDQFTLKKPVQTSPTNTPEQTTTAQTTVEKPAAVEKPKVVSSNSATKSLKIKEEFQASPMDAYDAFVNITKIRAYTQSDCTFEDREGGKFAMYGGFISGTNVQLSPGSKIVQKWRLNTWADTAFSTVTITFTVGDKPVTQVEINQTGIPSEEFEKTEEGWRRNIIERMKMVLGFGSRLY